jgi:hypothetical protein
MPVRSFTPTALTGAYGAASPASGRGDKQERSWLNVALKRGCPKPG